MTSFWEASSPLADARVHDGGNGWIGGESLSRLADDSVARLPPASLFALRFATNAASVATYLGALRHGHVPLLVAPDLDESLLEPLRRRFGIRWTYDGAAGTWTETAAFEGPAPALHPGLGVVMPTSGSTGSPKLVRLSRGNLAANAASIRTYLELDDSHTAITSLPLSYSYGLSVLNSHLASGARIVLSDAAVTTAGFWQLFRAEGVTSLAGVPTTWRMLRRFRFERMDLPTLECMTQAGGRLEPEEIAWLGELGQRTGRRVFIMYGQTEATARIAYLRPDQVLAKAGSIGRPIPGGELWLADEQGEPVPRPGVEGQLMYRGPNVMMGYAETRQDLALGQGPDVLATGDLARADDDGDFWITGRLKRFVKLFGNRFGLDEIERQLLALGHDAGVVGRDDALMIGLVGDAETARALHLQLAERYRIHFSALRVHPLEALPRNAAGKLLYAELQRQLDRLASQGVPQ